MGFSFWFCRSNPLVLNCTFIINYSNSSILNLIKNFINIMGIQNRKILEKWTIIIDLLFLSRIFLYFIGKGSMHLQTIMKNNLLDQGRLKPKFYCVHFSFSAFSFCVWRPFYNGGAFDACVFGTRWTRLEPALYWIIIDSPFLLSNAPSARFRNFVIYICWGS
jgi:hypothetical protein